MLNNFSGDDPKIAPESWKSNINLVLLFSLFLKIKFDSKPSFEFIEYDFLRDRTTLDNLFSFINLIASAIEFLKKSASVSSTN